jgi:hypothetical protein
MTSGGTGQEIAQLYSMSLRPKSTEEQIEKIDVIDGAETLGYEGSGREEHSGENTPEESDGMKDDLADNLPADR